MAAKPGGHARGAPAPEARPSTLSRWVRQSALVNAVERERATLEASRAS